MVNVFHLADQFTKFFNWFQCRSNLRSLCICRKTVTNPWKLKFMDFWWSQWHYIHVKFGHNVKQSQSYNFMFRETVHDSPSQHVMIMPAECRWHYIGYPLSDLSVGQVLLLFKLSAFHLSEYCVQTVSCLTQQLVESVLLASNGCIKILSTLGKQCGLRRHGVLWLIVL